MAKVTAEKAQRLKVATAAADAWNDRYGVGQLVEWQSHPEAPAKPHKTRSGAFVVDEQVACVMLHRVQGCVALSRCRPIDASAAAEFSQAAGGANNPQAIQRARLRERLRAIAVEADLLRKKLIDAQATLGDGTLLEFSLAAKDLGRGFEALSLSCFDLPVLSTAKWTGAPGAFDGPEAST